jgi:outer membrane usher protein
VLPHWALCGLFLIGMPGHAQTPSWSEVVMEVALQGQTDGDTLVVLVGPDRALYLDDEEFNKLRLRLPPVPPHEHAGRHYYPLSAIRGCTVAIDEVRQRAVISAPARAFETTTLAAADRQRPPVSSASPGAFLNYQLSAQDIQGTKIEGGYGELGVFSGAGVLTNSGIARDDSGFERFVRLDTTFTRDFPDQLETLNVGDAISDPGSWGNAEHFAGFRFSRNFALRPDLLTTPLLTTAGTATVPSTVNVFVNNQLVSSNQVPAGPFVIDRLPTVTGTDAVNVVVTDALGRQQVVSQSFYTGNTLLARDLTQYSVDLGSVRDDYGLASDHYGGLLGEASYRRGITDNFTLEGHGEYLSGDAHAAGVNAVLGVAQFATVNATLAYGGGGGAGVLSGVGIEHHGLNTNFLASTSWASRGFAQVGEPVDPDMRIHQRSLLQAGTGVGRWGSLSIAYVWQSYRASPAQQTLAVTDSLSLGSVGALNLTVSRTQTAAATGAAAQASTSAYLIFTHSLGGRTAVTATAVAASGNGAPQNEVIAGISESPPAGPGAGYRLSASTGGNYDADWRQQMHDADVEVEAARNEGIDGKSLQLSGAVTWLDGIFTPSRAVNGSFAVVDVAGLPNVPVYVENQLVTHTDDSGKALLYNLQPFEVNHISIEPEDLPLDTVVSTKSTLIVPPYRSGVVARFPVERVRSGTFKLVTEDGKPVPVGAVVTLMGAPFPVVLDGMVYVTGFDHGIAADATWPGNRCTFRLDPPDGDVPQPDMGTVICRRATVNTPVAR